jgi:hypothetical protein
MPDDSTKRPWEERVSEVSGRMEEELRRVVRFINDEVVPEVRTNGSEALRVAAKELHKLADYMDSRRTSAPPPRSPEDTRKP